MSERELMLRGEIYNPRDPELLALARAARAAVARFAAVPAEDAAGRHAALCAVLDAAEGVWVEPPFFCEYGRHIRLGRDTFVNANCVFLDAAPISVGADVLIAPGVQLLTASHPVVAGERLVPPAERGAGQAPYRTWARPITIGDGVWLGAGAIVLPGVTIGARAVIGAGSVVSRDVPANCVAVGQPCRVQRILPEAGPAAP